MAEEYAIPSLRIKNKTHRRLRRRQRKFIKQKKEPEVRGCGLPGPKNFCGQYRLIPSLFFKLVAIAVLVLPVSVFVFITGFADFEYGKSFHQAARHEL